MKTTMMTTQVRRAFRYNPVLEMSPCGRWLIAWCDYGARVFDAAQPGPPLWRTEETVLGLRVAGDVLIYIMRKPNRLVAVRLTGSAEVGACALPSTPLALAVDVARGRVFVAGEDGALRRFVLSERGLEASGELAGAPCQYAHLALAPDGSFLAAAFSPRDARSVPVLRVDPEALAVTHTHKGLRSQACGIHICPNSQMIVASTSSSAQVWTGPKAKAQTLLKAQSYMHVVGFVDAEHVILLDCREVAVCVHVPSLAQVWSHEHYGPAALSGEILVHCRFHQLSYRDARTGALLGQSTMSGYPRALVVDGARGAAHLCGSLGSLIHTWPLDERSITRRDELGGDMVQCLAVSADGALWALGTATGAVMVYASSAPEQPLRVYTPPGEHESCHAIDIDITGDRLWAACGARLARWVLSTGELEVYSAHQKSELYAMCILPERGEIIAAARGSRRSYGELAVLDLETLQTLHTERLTETVLDITRGAGDEVLLRGGYGTRGFDVARRVFTTYTVNRARGASVSDAAPMAVRTGSRFNRERDDYDYWLERVTLEEDPKPIGDKIVCPAAVSGQPIWLERPGELVIALLYDRTVRVWDLVTGDQVACYPVHVGAPNVLLKVPGGELFMACGTDGTVELITLDI